MISNELLKGSLKTIVLTLLKEKGPLHGYAITQKAEELTAGRIKLTYGALYPLLHKLEKEKILVTAREIKNNRIRVYYSLTLKRTFRGEGKDQRMKNTPGYEGMTKAAPIIFDLITPSGNDEAWTLRKFNEDNLAWVLIYLDGLKTNLKMIKMSHIPAY